MCVRIMMASTDNKGTDKSSTVRPYIHRNLRRRTGMWSEDLARYLHLAQIGLFLIALCLLGGLGRYTSPSPSHSNPRRRLPSDNALESCENCAGYGCFSGCDCGCDSRDLDETCSQCICDGCAGTGKVAVCKPEWLILSAHTLNMPLTTNSTGQSVTQEDNIVQEGGSLNDAQQRQYWSVKWCKREDSTEYCYIYNQHTNLYLCAGESKPILTPWYSEVFAAKEYQKSVRPEQKMWKLRQVCIKNNKILDCGQQIGGQPSTRSGSYYILENAHSGFVLDVDGGSNSAGTKIITYKLKGNKISDRHCKNQVFQFVKE